MASHSCLPGTLASLILLLALAPTAGGAASCPLVVPRQQSLFQPVRIEPEQVPRKNAAGCLSGSDAIYRPDGCPLRLCPANAPGLEL